MQNISPQTRRFNHFHPKKEASVSPIKETNCQADDQSDSKLLKDDFEVPTAQNINDSSRSELEEEQKQDQEFSNLSDLVGKLNDEDDSEDEGIEDYKHGGYHPCHIGQVLANRYVLIQKLGWGHFSTVWLAKDFKYSTYVAVKIMKSSAQYMQGSYDQIQILQKVAKNALKDEWLRSLKIYEPNKKKYDMDDTHVLNLLNAFLYKGPYGKHFCMVFEILGMNLWQAMKKYNLKGLPINVVKEITRQVLMGLDFLNRICRVIHTDLKPENVMLCLSEDELRKIVDDHQLANAGDYEERLKYYCEKFGLGPKAQSKDKAHLPTDCVSSSSSEEEEQLQKTEISQEINALDLKIAQIKQKIEATDSQNYKKTLKKKLKKLEENRDLQVAKLETLKKEQQNTITQEKPQSVINQQLPINRKSKSLKQLFFNFKNKISFDNTQSGLTQNLKIKIADLGNACWQHRHFSYEIQTRPYRAPEVMLGSKYNGAADMWSVACMTFQLLTGEVLFNPQKDGNDVYTKNDDHLAQMMELLGRFPKKMSMRGDYAKKYMNSKGSLNRIPKLQSWSLKDIMMAKYHFRESQAQMFEDFMLPMLNCYPERRLLSHQMLKSPWLYLRNPENHHIQNSHKLRKIHNPRTQFSPKQDKAELYQYESDEEDAQEQDNGELDEQDFYKSQKVGDIKLIDQSFTDLGYLGYGSGIHLDKLDCGPNWQFV